MDKLKFKFLVWFFKFLIISGVVVAISFWDRNVDNKKLIQDYLSLMYKIDNRSLFESMMYFNHSSLNGPFKKVLKDKLIY
jgi:hypothetical protein